MKKVITRALAVLLVVVLIIVLLDCIYTVPQPMRAVIQRVSSV